MIRIDKMKFSETTAAYIDKVQAGETIVITQNDKPVAEIRPVAEPSASGKRVIGFAPGMATILPGFWDPLPDDELALWNGEGK